MWKELIEKSIDKAPLLLDLFAPEVQNTVMKKKFNNAVKAIEAIKSSLAEYGLQVDYKAYFERELQIPLMSVRALAEVRTEKQQELLKNLFMRHLSGKYSDDSRYPRFIHMIQEDLQPLDIQVLLKIKECDEGTLTFPVTEDEYNRFVFEKGNVFNAGWEAVKSSLDTLLSFRLINILHNINVPKIDDDTGIIIDAGDAGGSSQTTIPQQKALQSGRPELTELGKLFLSACADPLRK